MWRARALKVVLVLVGLIFSAGMYPLISSLLHPAGSDRQSRNPILKQAKAEYAKLL